MRINIRLFTVLVLILGMSFFVACEDPGDDDHGDNDNNTVSQVDTFYCTFDGTLRIFDEEVEMYRTGEGQMVDAEDSEGTFDITFVDTLAEGTYTAWEHVHMTYHNAAYTIGVSSEFEDLGASATVTITEYAPSDYIEGTFSGTMMDFAGGNQMVITDGVFSVDLGDPE